MRLLKDGSCSLIILNCNFQDSRKILSKIVIWIHDPNNNNKFLSFTMMLPLSFSYIGKKICCMVLEPNQIANVRAERYDDADT